MTQVQTGKQLTYARTLAKRRKWPPTRIKRQHGDAPPAMPYIVVPADAADDGLRPVDPVRAAHSTAIEVLDAGGAPVDFPVPGTAYALRATVLNRGPAAAYGGVAEFFVGGEAHGVEGFVAPANGAVTISCRRSWTPANAAAAASPVIVCAYDALLDRPEQRFAPSQDRHVGQHDLLADFSGVWDGLAFFANAPGGAGTLYRIEIQQKGVAVAVAIYQQVHNFVPTTDPQVLHTPLPSGPMPRPMPGGMPGPAPSALGGGVLPAQPQLEGAATIVGNRVELHLTGLNFTPPVPFTNDDVTLTLTGPDTLHVTHHETFVDPADPRGPIDLVADLKR